VIHKIYFWNWLMLAKKYRLTGRVVHALTRKWQRFHGSFFSLMFFAQVSRYRYHQISFHVSKKVDKSAVVRNRLKRIVIESLVTHKGYLEVVWGGYYKFFLTINMKKLQDRQQLVANNDKKAMTAQVMDWFEKDWDWVHKCFPVVGF